MRRVLSLVLLAAVAPAVGAQETQNDSPLEARVWLDRGDEPVLQRADRVRVYYRTSSDAHTAIFRIDTDGRVTLIQPAHPGAELVTRGGSDYRLLFPRSSEWIVSDDPGVGYFFIVAADRPLDFSDFDFVPEEERWDLQRVGETVYEDPYLAIDDFVAELIPDWEVTRYTLDFIEYSVGEAHEYPRFLCYDCHGYQPYTRWDPYSFACTDFRVVTWADPYYYPAYRYAGNRVVFPRPLRGRPRYTIAVRGPGEGWSPVVRTRPAPLPQRRVTQYKEPHAAPAPASATTPARRPQTRAPNPAPGAVPRRSTSAPDRAVTPNSDRRATKPATASTAPPRRLSSGGSTPRPATSKPGTSPRRPAQPSASRPSAGRVVTPRSATPRSTTQSRPTLQRRPSGTTTRSRPSDRTNVSRPNGSRPSTTRAPAASGSRTRVVTPNRPRTQPQASGRRSVPVTTRRAPVTTSRAPVTTRRAPVTTSRAPVTTSRPPAARAPVTRSVPATRSTPTATRSRPPAPRASAAASGARPTTSRPTTRSAPPARPTVRARPTAPPRRGGRGGRGG